MATDTPLGTGEWVLHRKAPAAQHQLAAAHRDKGPALSYLTDKCRHILWALLESMQGQEHKKTVHILSLFTPFTCPLIECEKNQERALRYGKYYIQKSRLIF
jgi:hypothetical protein